jgi:hypothetical protein
MARKANQDDPDLHPDPSPSGYRYYFHPKHHGRGPADDARWLPLPEMSREEEFAVFVMADVHELSDNKGNLYGLRIRGSIPGHQILFLGTRREQVARFWKAPQG